LAKSMPVVLLLLVSQCLALAQDDPQTDFKKLSLEQLLDVNVSSVTRRLAPLGQTAAAITVITGEDIRRIGVTGIAEALRLVPGMQVARVNASSWAISARGFSTQIADKMLVLIDGRTVYSPVFAGVFWELQDLVLDDVDRIEVVRGPGGTLWGANAVNGVVNIVTKNAHQTQSTTFIQTAGGAETLSITSFRTGAAIGADTSYRVYGKYFYRDQLVQPNGDPAQDSSRFGRSGIRIDNSHGLDELTVEAEAYRGFEGLFAQADAKLLGGHALGRWTRRISSDSSIRVQASYERLLRRMYPSSEIHQRIFDLDLQHQFGVGAHALSWGAGYRWNSDTTEPMPTVKFMPAKRSYPLQTAFIQDELSFLQNRVKLQLGSKVEHNDFSGFELQPAVRVSWAMRPNRFAWAAVSRAVRTPTRFDTETNIAIPPLVLAGNEDFESEKVVAFEAGYRTGLGARWSADLATFFNIYDDLRSTELSPASQPTPTIRFLNNLNAKTYGLEFGASFDATDSFRVTSGYSYLGKRLRMNSGHADIFGNFLEGDDPKHQFFVRTSLDMPHRVEWDSTLRFVGRLQAPGVPSYFELDARLGWNPAPRVELSLIGRNLFHNRHREFSQASPIAEEVQRDIYGRVALRF
jgi:iron complex outermembrane recepter protein